MASVSVYRSTAKNVFGTKNFTLPSQDTGYLSAPSPELYNYHDNYCQQRPGQSKNKVLASQSLYSKH